MVCNLVLVVWLEQMQIPQDHMLFSSCNWKELKTKSLMERWASSIWQAQREELIQLIRISRPDSMVLRSTNLFSHWKNASEHLTLRKSICHSEDLNWLKFWKIPLLETLRPQWLLMSHQPALAVSILSTLLGMQIEWKSWKRNNN